MSKNANDIGNFGIVIHGGAGTILREKMSAEMEAEVTARLAETLRTGYEILETGGSSLDAVQRAVNVMEDSPLFNAGKGAVFTHDGKNEQDATIVDGATGMAGAVAGVKHVANPINLARMVMEKTPHVLLIGDGAETFAVTEGMHLVDEKYFHTERRREQLEKALEKERKAGKGAGPFEVRLSEDDRHGTVGAVALDKEGNLAAATSSGGMTNKKFGRVGDSALIGAGTWADNDTCAVSTTGHGEYFMRGVVAYDIAALMAYKNMSLEEAAASVIHSKLTLREGTGGLIAIDRQGNFTLPFNTEGMYRGHLMKDGQVGVRIFRD